MQKNLPTRSATDTADVDYVKMFVSEHDANDLLYALDASRNYDPSAQLERITASVEFVNSADDFINPPELGIAEREIKRVKNGRFVLLPISDQTHGHGTHTWAAVWQLHLKELLDVSQH
jgi:homoserine O-acetyltransferase